MLIKKNIFAFFVIAALGTVGHFLYKWSGENTLIGYFFSTNESTWEHLKLLFFPTVFYSVFEYIFSYKKPQNYIPTVIISVLCGMTAIVTLFYTINGVLGYNVDFLNIAIYYLAVIIMLIKKEKLIRMKNFSYNPAFWFFLIIGAITAVLFIIWTYNPPSLGIFTPPVIN